MGYRNPRSSLVVHHRGVDGMPMMLLPVAGSPLRFRSLCFPTCVPCVTPKPIVNPVSKGLHTQSRFGRREARRCILLHAGRHVARLVHAVHPQHDQHPVDRATTASIVPATAADAATAAAAAVGWTQPRDES